MSAFNGNYSGGTFLSNLVSRPEFLQYTAEGIFEQSKWIQSGIVQRNAALDARAGGTRVRVPFFDPIAPTESQILSNSTWGGGGGYLVPSNVTADEQIMTILHRGFAYAADDLSKLGSGADPLAHVRNQLTAAINKLKTATLAAQLLGLFGPIASNGVLGPNSLNKSFAGVPGSMTEANFLNVANVVGTKALLGERGDELDSIAMHSNVAYYLQQVGMLVFSTSALSTGGAITWGGGGIGLSQTEVPLLRRPPGRHRRPADRPHRRHRHPRQEVPRVPLQVGRCLRGHPAGSAPRRRPQHPVHAGRSGCGLPLRLPHHRHQVGCRHRQPPQHHRLRPTG
jgi:hypothetical protein